MDTNSQSGHIKSAPCISPERSHDEEVSLNVLKELAADTANLRASMSGKILHLDTKFNGAAFSKLLESSEKERIRRRTRGSAASRPNIQHINKNKGDQEVLTVNQQTNQNNRQRTIRLTSISLNGGEDTTNISQGPKETGETIRKETGPIDAESPKSRKAHKKTIIKKVVICNFEKIERPLSKKKGYVVFLVQVDSDKEQWQVKRRYREFTELAKELGMAKYPGLPNLPGKRGVTVSVTPVFLSKRQELLQQYMDTLISLPHVAQSKTFIRFLDPYFNPSANTVKPDKAGWMLKQGHIRKNWKRRWFVLKGQTLWYYTEQYSSSPCGTVPLEFCSIEVVPGGTSGKGYCFEMQCWSQERNYLIKVGSEEEMQEWIHALRSKKSAHMNENMFLSNSDTTPSRKESINATRLNSLKSLSGPQTASAQSLWDLVDQSGDQEEQNKKTHVFKKNRARDSAFDYNSLDNQEDSEDNIKIVDEKIVAATVPKLVEKLLDDTMTDFGFVQTFILTYRSFVSPSNFLKRLIQFFRAPPPRKYTSENSQSGETSNSTYRDPSQLRVCIVLLKWLDISFQDFIEDTALTNRLVRFIDESLSSKDWQSTAVKLKTSIKKMLNRESEEPTITSPRIKDYPEPILPSLFSADHFDLIDLAPLEVARQLTILEQNLYNRVRPFECMNQNWNKKERDSLAPNITAVINRFNSMSNWVTSLIVSVEEVKLRASLVGRFIEIAEKCYELSNFNSIMEILSGLGSAAVFRLKKTWRCVPSTRMAVLNELKKMVSTENNYKAYRETLRSVTPPCVPYLGVYLTWLTFIDTGNPDSLGNGMVNWGKRMALASVIKEIQMYQKPNYSLTPVEPLQDYLWRLDRLSEEEVFELSLLNEPRETSGSRIEKKG